MPVTVLHMENVQVVAQRTGERDGYTAVQLGVGRGQGEGTRGDARPFRRRQGRAEAQAGEFRVSPENPIGVGEEITADHYFAGQYVDIAGTSIGKGLCRRCDEAAQFRRPGRRHGVSVSHRSHGSTGSARIRARSSRAEDGRPYGRRPRHHAESAEVVRTDADRGLIAVKGAVPGLEGRLGHDQGRGEEAFARNVILPAALGRRPKVPIGAKRPRKFRRLRPKPSPAAEAEQAAKRGRGGSRRRCRCRGRDQRRNETDVITPDAGARSIEHPGSRRAAGDILHRWCATSATRAAGTHKRSASPKQLFDQEDLRQKGTGGASPRLAQGADLPGMASICQGPDARSHAHDLTKKFRALA